MTKKCPFCGGDTNIDKILRDGYEKYPDDPDAFAYVVRCISCAAEGGWAKTEGNAIRNWNMRSEKKNSQINFTSNQTKELEQLEKVLKDKYEKSIEIIWRVYEKVFLSKKSNTLIKEISKETGLSHIDICEKLIINYRSYHGKKIPSKKPASQGD